MFQIQLVLLLSATIIDPVSKILKHLQSGRYCRSRALRRIDVKTLRRAARARLKQ